MKVSYKGFTGELVRLEQVDAVGFIEMAGRRPAVAIYDYNLVIHDRENNATHSFPCVKLEDVKFIGAAVSFAG